MCFEKASHHSEPPQRASEPPHFASSRATRASQSSQSSQVRKKKREQEASKGSQEASRKLASRGARRSEQQEAREQANQVFLPKFKVWLCWEKLESTIKTRSVRLDFIVTSRCYTIGGRLSFDREPPKNKESREKKESRFQIKPRIKYVPFLGWGWGHAEPKKIEGNPTAEQSFDSFERGR